MSTTAERFWAKVDKSGACWLWTGALGNDGYGVMRVACSMMQAHRLAWILTHHVNPDGCVLHSCDNPRCVNPAHLRVGTHAENMREMRERGRHRCTAHRLNLEIATQARAAHAAGETVRALAARFGVSRVSMQKVISGRTWKPSPALSRTAC